MCSLKEMALFSSVRAFLKMASSQNYVLSSVAFFRKQITTKCRRGFKRKSIVITSTNIKDVTVSRCRRELNFPFLIHFV